MANDIIDINVTETVETIEITVNPNLTTVNINQVTGGGGGGITDLGYIATPTNGTVTSSTGTSATIPLADGTNAGLITPAEKTKIANSVPYTGAVSDVNLGEFGIQLGNLEFDNTPTNIPTSVGSLVWNDTAGTLDLKLKGGATTLQIGQETVARVVNKTATNITLLESKYQVVRVTGAQGQRPKVDLALADNDLNSTTTLGLVTENILNNQEGFITTSGQVQQINTTGSLQGETWADGDVLYLSGTVAGQATNIKPIAPIHTVILGFVEYAHITQGKIFVKVDNGYELEELHNVSAIAPNNNEVLTYDSATLLWKPKTVFQLPSLTSGSVLFSNGTTIAQDNANLFWDDTNNRLGIGTATPAASLDVAVGNVVINYQSSYGSRNSVNNIVPIASIGTGNMSGLSQSNLYKAGYASTNGFEIGTASAVGIYGIDSDGTNIKTFGIYTNNTRRFTINSFGNVLIGTTLDNGSKLNIQGSITAATAIARGQYLAPTLVASANNDVLVGLDIAPTFTNGGFTGVANLSARFNGSILNTIGTANLYTSNVYSGNIVSLHAAIPTTNNAFIRSDGSTFTILNAPSATAILYFRTNNINNAALFSTGNLLLQNGGTFTDNGYRLDVNGTGRFNSALTIQGVTGTNFGNASFAVAHGSGNARWIYTATSSETSIYDNINNITPFRIKLGALDNSLTISALGNTLLNTITDAGYKLDVNGTQRVQGLSSLNSVVVNNTVLNASAVLQADSTTKGFLPPRMTNAQRIAIATPAIGLCVYCTDATEGLYVNKSTGWTLLL